MKGLKTTSYRRKRVEKFTNFIFRVFPFVFFIYFFWAQTNLVLVKNYVYSTNELPKAFVGYKIMHVSDICNKELSLIRKAKNADPDIILVSGGYNDISGKHNKSNKILDKLSKIAPVYYIYNTNDAGNEIESTNVVNITDTTVEVRPNIKDAKSFIQDNYGNSIIKQADKGDVESLEYIEYINKALNSSNDSLIKISGFGVHPESAEGKEAIKVNVLDLIGTDISDVTIMMNSNIGNLDTICETHTDIVLFGGTFGEDKLGTGYKKGTYGNNGTQLFVSGGIGETKEFIRFFNLPEFQIITLSDGTISNKNPLEEMLSRILPDVGTIFDNDGGFQKHVIEYGNEYMNND